MKIISLKCLIENLATYNHFSFSMNYFMQKKTLKKMLINQYHINELI